MREYEDDEIQATIIDYTRTSFRDSADGDYLAARILYRNGLDQQFLWSALQAIEKYLKGILCLNDVSTKGLQHDIESAHARLEDISDIEFQIPADVLEFIRYLNFHGPNRYFEHPSFAMGKELLKLDRAVWHVRRYCQYLRGAYDVGDEKIERLSHELEDIHSYTVKDSHRFRIFGGRLEKILQTKKDPLREQLVWKNFYYGSNKKRIVRNFAMRGWAANPAHYNHPEAFPELEQLVQFSKGVRDYFSSDG